MDHSLVVAAAHLVLTGVSVFLVAKLLPGVQAKSLGSAVAFAFVVAALNALMWGALAPYASRVTAVAPTLGALVLNGLVFLVAARIVGGVKISGCFMAIIASVGVTLLNSLMHPFFGKWAP